MESPDRKLGGRVAFPHPLLSGPGAAGMIGRIPNSREPGMTVDRLRDALRAEPFRPFRIHLADGKAVEVRHRDFVAISPPGRTIVVFEPHPEWADGRSHWIDLLLVTALEILPTAA